MTQTQSMTTVGVNCENVLKIWEDFESGVYAKDEIFRFEEWSGDVEAFVKNVPMHRRLYAVDVYEGLDSDVRYELGAVPEKRVEGYVVYEKIGLVDHSLVGRKKDDIGLLWNGNYNRRGQDIIAQPQPRGTEHLIVKNDVSKESLLDLQSYIRLHNDCFMKCALSNVSEAPDWLLCQLNLPRWLIDDLSGAYWRFVKRQRPKASKLHQYQLRCEASASCTETSSLDILNRLETHMSFQQAHYEVHGALRDSIVANHRYASCTLHSHDDRLNSIETSINTLRDVTSASIDATHQYVTKSIEPLAQEFKVHQQHTSAYLQQNKCKIQDVESKLHRVSTTLTQQTEQLTTLVNEQRQRIDYLIQEQSDQRYMLMRMFFVIVAMMALVKML